MGGDKQTSEIFAALPSGPIRILFKEGTEINSRSNKL